MDESVPLTLLEDATSLAARKTQILRKANASKPPNGSNASGFNRKFQGTDTMSFPFPIGAQKRDIAPAVSNPPLPAKRESVYKEQPPLSQGVSAYRDQPQATQRESVFKEQSSSPQRESIYKEQPSSPQRQSLYQMPAPAMNRSDSSLATTEVPPPSSLEKTRKASVSFVPRKSTRAENAFHHTATQRRLSHLMNTEVKGTDQLGFIFEALHDEMDESKLEHEAPTIPANPNDLLNEISPPIDPTDLKMVAAAPPDVIFFLPFF